MHKFVCLILILLAGCMTIPHESNRSCGTFDTTKVLKDLDNPIRTDQEWNEAIIRRMAWHLDCYQKL